MTTKERKREYNHKYHVENRESIHAHKRKYYIEHRKSILETQRKYNAEVENKEKAWPRAQVHITNTETFKYLRTYRGIAYFEGGWWMHEIDRCRDLLEYPNVKANRDTKQIETDHTNYSFPTTSPKKKTK